jgi:formylglycine-generating enzyme required for sulfatase activity
MYDMSYSLDTIQLKFLEPNNHWFDSPQKRFEPLVSVTYDQVLKYCDWRSKIASKKLNRQVIFRLPTKEEWFKIANYALIHDYRYSKKMIARTKKKLGKNSEEYILISIPELANRMCHMFDNVSEMTQEYGIAVGANNSDLIDLEKNLNKTYAYDKPSFYIGFRCVAEFVD